MRLGNSTYQRLQPMGGSQHHINCSCAQPAVAWVYRRLNNHMSRRPTFIDLAGSRSTTRFSQIHNSANNNTISKQAVAANPGPANSPSNKPSAQPQKPIVLSNLRYFDGQQLKLIDGMAIRIEGNKIASIDPVSTDQGDVQLIDCNGKVLIPGLIDAHWHSLLCGISQMVAMTAPVPYLHLVAGHQSTKTLMRGFTTVRDAGGPSFSLKMSIDQGLIPGPRIYPAGAMISQTSGHGDFRMQTELPATPNNLSHAEKAGVSAIANGTAQVLNRVREQLMLGASQIKMMVGGGVTSLYDPIASLQFTEDELRAGVAAASDWGTYVMAHVYTSAGIQRAIKAGIKSIEHGQLADETTARMMADNGIWWSLQPFLADEDANQHADPRAHADQIAISQGTINAYEMAKKFNVQTAWGTDILFTPQNLPRHGHMLSKLQQFYDPLEVLRMATGNNGQLLSMSGLRNPYKGKLGVIEVGALADVLLVNGEPDKNLDFIDQPDENLKIIMKDGHIYKNIL